MGENILKSRKGGSTIFEIVICLGVIVFILFYPVGIFSLTHKQNLLEDVLTLGLQMAAVEGGLTDNVEGAIYLNLEAKGLLPQNSSSQERSIVKINSNADARGGNTAALKYRDEEDPIIMLEILYPADTEVKFLNGLSRLIGASNIDIPFKVADGVDVQWYYSFKGYIMSEKVDY